MDLEYANLNTPSDPGPAEEGVFASGDVLLIQNGAVGPDRCVKCNGPVHGHRFTLKLRWHAASHWVWLAFVVFGTFGIILLFGGAREVRVRLSLCRQHRAQRILIALAIYSSIITAIVTLVGGFTVFVRSTGQTVGESIPYFVGSGICLLFTAIFAIGLGPILRVHRIEDDIAWASGASKDYLASLPEGRVESNDGV